MAKKKSSTRAVSHSGAKKKRIRRTPEQIISDLQVEISRLRVKAKAKELKKSPGMKAALSVMRQLDKALELSAEEGLTGLRHALADARKALGGFLEKEGLDLPKVNMPRGRRPK